MKKNLAWILTAFMVSILFACGGGGGSSSNDSGPSSGGSNSSGPGVNSYITGRVIDDKGTGLAGAKVEMMDSHGVTFWSATTDVGGNFTDGGCLTMNNPITGTIIAAKAGFSPNALIFSISPGEHHPPVEVVLKTGGSGGAEIGRIRFSGTVKLSDGKSAEGISVSVNRLTEEGSFIDVFFTRTDASGNFADDGTIVLGKVMEFTISIFAGNQYYSKAMNLTASPGGTYNLGIITLAVIP
jgi:hypothetical protein